MRDSNKMMMKKTKNTHGCLAKIIRVTLVLYRNKTHPYIYI